MRIRKTLTTLALCTAGMSVVGAGTALAEEVVGQFPSSQACSAALEQHSSEGDPGPLMCNPVEGADPSGPNNLVRG